MAGGPHPIPSRTRSLSPLAPMVLRLKAWESRSLPGPQSPVIQTCRHIFPLRRFWSRLRPAARIFLADLSGPRGRICISGVSLLNVDNADAGWSSPVARQAHNLKVVGSNPTPAPNKTLRRSRAEGSCLQNIKRTGEMLEEWSRLSTDRCAGQLSRIALALDHAEYGSSYPAGFVPIVEFFRCDRALSAYRIPSAPS